MHAQRGLDGEILFPPLAVSCQGCTVFQQGEGMLGLPQGLAHFIGVRLLESWGLGDKRVDMAKEGVAQGTPCAHCTRPPPPREAAVTNPLHTQPEHQATALLPCLLSPSLTLPASLLLLPPSPCPSFTFKASRLLPSGCRRGAGGGRSSGAELRAAGRKDLQLLSALLDGQLEPCTVGGERCR